MIRRSPTKIMGILNCTQDSFYTKNRAQDLPSAMDLATQMLQEGVDIIDIGGESTRPGAKAVAPQAQMDRIIPVIRAIRGISSIRISVDTRSAQVAAAALDVGANMINDVSALSFDPHMAPLIAHRRVPVVLMHRRGLPETMQNNPSYVDPVLEVRQELRYSVHQALAAGIERDQIILDPGIGFAKRLEDNVALLQHVSVLKEEGFPLLVGLSRKSFLGSITGKALTPSLHSTQRDCKQGSARKKRDNPADRFIRTLAAHAWCLGQGVDILRVHDVEETAEFLATWEAIAWNS